MEDSRYKSWLLKNIIIGIHVISWLVFFHISFDLQGLYYSFIDLNLKGPQYYFDEAFILIPFILVLFYWNSQFLIPKYFNPKYWWKYIIYLFISYFLCSQMSVLLFHWLFDFGWVFHIDLIEFEDVIYTLYLIIVLASLVRGIAKLALENAHQAKEAKEKYKEAELNYLQAQVNPHFIFNTLNALYALSEDEKAEKTTEAILKFSELMRYPMHKGYLSEVPLMEELEFIDGYIHLQKLKLGEDYPIIFLKNGTFEGVNIMPLCFIALVENAFKYGISQRFKNAIKFKLYTEGNSLYFESENKINISDTIESHRIGLENLKQRLKLFYGDLGTLIILNDKNIFKVKLMIPLK